MAEISYIFDTHAHYDSSKFNEDRDAVLGAMPGDGVGRIINCGCDRESSLTSIALAERYDFVYAAVGVHPEELESYDEAFAAELENLLDHPKVVAIGEIGLDYHYKSIPRDRQMDVFDAQLALAKKKNVPVIIHDREAHGDMYRLLRWYAPLKGVMHCFSGSVELAREAVEMGLHVGLGGAVTFSNAVHPLEVAASIPADRLLLETDAPYMTPEPFRGKRCDSRLIEFTAKRIAQVREMCYEDVLSLAAKNASELFGIPL